ncbi:hypothetical protein H5410_013057 [Solanum commersonii]|uniref:CCHC-type domain-containing protein n=1 Tax=Solanum commersonii TaxID=4109 RepID=A0A9J6AUL3_SOLCO|nr:hypothetical protein H5410_013057 [Solanum commersonii]
MINDGDTVKVYVFHRVSEANQAPLELEFVPNVSDSGVGKESFNEASNPNNQPPTSTFPSIPTTGPSENSSTQFEDQSTTMPPLSPSTVPSSSTVPPLFTVPPPSPCTVPPPSFVPLSDPIIDNDPTDDQDLKGLLLKILRESLVGKLGGDEPYYLSDETLSFEIDDETSWGDGENVDQVVHKPVRRKKTPNRVVFDATSEKIVWELGLDIIRKELDINVGRTTVRRARTRVLQEIMGDHIVEYESFNAWILPARFKTIITMLEEIRVKIMKKISDLREFSNTWITDISHMSLKILQENIGKSMQCNLTWNGERGFEIKHHGFTHTVDIVSRSCSCKSWQLKGIPCPHGVVALHYKELDLIHYVASCYSKETYLSTYAYFIQPMNNMKIWPTSNNSIVKPSKIKKLPGRSGKVRRKEADESRKTGKLSKRGVVMTCSKCGTQGHNKKECPTRNQAGPSQSTEPSSQAQPRLPSRRVINTGTRVTKRADVVIGDIGYTPVRGFKWKGKTSITSSNLERMRAEKVIHTRSATAATANSQSQTTSSRKTYVPWK